MNIIELEEGLRNLITTQPAILSGPNAAVISGIKNIIEAHKVFIYRVEEYPEQDILKVVPAFGLHNLLEMPKNPYIL